MARANVDIRQEVSTLLGSGWTLCLQWAQYNYDDGSPSQMGYRFIYRRPNGSLQAAMGQARVPSAAVMFDLIHKATEAGWFIACEANRTGDVATVVEEDA